MPVPKLPKPVKSCSLCKGTGVDPASGQDGAPLEACPKCATPDALSSLVSPE